MDINNAVNDLLLRFITTSQGIKQIMLSDATGLIISKVTKEETDDSDFEGIASISTALYLGMSELQLGKLGFNLSDFTNSNLCLYGVTREYVIIAITHKNISIKKLKAGLKMLRDDVSDVLDLLKTSEKIEVKRQEIMEKSIGLEKEEFEKLLDELTF